MKAMPSSLPFSSPARRAASFKEILAASFKEKKESLGLLEDMYSLG